MATLHSSIYTNGINDIFLNESKTFAICLLNASNEVLATSAPIKYSSIAVDGYITGVIYWNNGTKQLTFNSLDFTKTKSIIDTEIAASQFGILEVNKITDDKDESYPTAGTKYYWPHEFGEILVSGSLSSTINVNKNNNFRFDSITISFSEADSL